MDKYVRTGIVTLAGTVVLGTAGLAIANAGEDDLPIKREDTSVSWMQDTDDDLGGGNPPTPPSDDDATTRVSAPSRVSARSVVSKPSKASVRSKASVPSKVSARSAASVPSKPSVGKVGSVGSVRGLRHQQQHLMLESWGLVGGDAIAPGLTAVKPVGGGTAYEAWVAFDERLYAPVVVKVLRPSQVGDAIVRAGMLREIQMLQQLNHPGIVRLFAYDVDGERPYLVLENIDGPNLSSLISTHGHLPLHQLLPLALELSSALHYLAEEGVCHLDIKPSNVIMGAPAKLIDLSLAMSARDAADLLEPSGTDEYMAPEQCRPGVLGRMGHPSDVWSVGATLFRAAAGYRAWEREPRWRQLNEEPYDLPEFVPGPLVELIRDCLAIDPAARPLPSELAERLEPMFEQLPKARLSGFSIKL